jgi:hypothetical protein
VDFSVTKALSKGDAQFVKDTVDGKEIIICKNVPDDIEVVKCTDSGEPFVYWLKIGNGKILFVNTLMYPGNEAVLPAYTEALKLLAKSVNECENVRVQCGDDVEYTMFVQDDGSKHIYLTATDWYNDSTENRKAVITIGSASCEVSVPFGQIIKIVTDSNMAVWPECDEAEVICVKDGSFKAQGFGSQNFFVFKDGVVTKLNQEF